MTRTKLTLSTVTIASAAGLTLAMTTLSPSLAGPKTVHTKSVITRGKMVKGNAGSHVKIATGKNTPGKEVHKTRAAMATVRYHNQTGWYIDCYVDGDAAGQVAPYSDLYINVHPGSIQLYAVAHFDDGSQKIWGPTDYEDDSFLLWALTD